MPLAVSLNSPAALFRKLEREGYRAYHAKSPTTKSDHFFNFCVTAASMRDYCLEHLGKIELKDKQPFFDTWTMVPALVAASEIANSTKHFVLRDRNTRATKALRTRALRVKKAKFIDVYAHDDGRTLVVPSARTEVSITLSDGTILELYAFIREVTDYWRTYLDSIGVKSRRQPLSQLLAR
ncbi:MAG: hypothetical protein JZU45_06765 [Methyloversatilis discipulorum]|uniref:hypothetical protein n=1 Tax=Methyloversatilis discipulorum TaxID=1119528 RepID=UPI0026EBD9BF|nr:hypothetical protein [Methyloversatilis discipulorum]MBV5285768.1 hypothetical protein [Methyloversatilis discipulorum]